MKKIAAISSKPQTTRNKITGVVHFSGGQIILLDTPGIHKASSQLNRLMVKASLSTYHDVDIILFVVDASQGFTENDFFDYDAKYSEGVSKHILPADIPSNIYQECLKKWYAQDGCDYD